MGISGPAAISLGVPARKRIAGLYEVARIAKDCNGLSRLVAVRVGRDAAAGGAVSVINCAVSCRRAASPASRPPLFFLFSRILLENHQARPVYVDTGLAERNPIWINISDRKSHDYNNILRGDVRDALLNLRRGDRMRRRGKRRKRKTTVARRKKTIPAEEVLPSPWRPGRLRGMS